MPSPISNTYCVFGCLNRSPRGIEPTHYADALLKRASTVFDELKQGVRDIEFLADPTGGDVRVGCAELFTARVIAGNYRKVGAAVSEDHGSCGLRAARNGGGGGGGGKFFFVGRISMLFSHDDLSTEVLYEEQYYVVVGAHNPLGALPLAAKSLWKDTS